MEIAVETSARRGEVTRLGPEQLANGRFEFQHDNARSALFKELGFCDTGCSSVTLLCSKFDGAAAVRLF